MPESTAFSRRSFAKAAKPTTLASAIDNVSTTLTFIDGSTYPDGSLGPFMITLDLGLPSEERVEVPSRTGNVCTGCIRGADGTTAQGHGTTVNGVTATSTARDFDEANAHIADTTKDHHSQYIRTDGTRGAVKSVAVDGTPRLYLKATDGASDRKVWDLVLSGGQLLGRAVNDAENATTTWLTVSRTGTVLTSVQLFTSGGVVTLRQSGQLDVGAGMSSGGASTGALVGIANISNLPSTPSGGGFMYVQAGALKYVGSSGTVTTLGAA